MSLTVGVSVPIVTLQFSFKNGRAVPEGLRELPSESPCLHKMRKARASGQLVINPIQNVSIFHIVEDVETSGYELVDAVYQTRIDPKDLSCRTVYHMVRFTFMRLDLVEENEEFASRRSALRGQLINMCLNSLWRVRGFCNPYYRRDEIVPDMSATCLNFEARVPLCDVQGDPVLVWKRDDAGHKIGTAPQPIRAQHRLVINQQCNIEVEPM